MGPQEINPQRYAHVMDKTAQQHYHDAMAHIKEALSLAPIALTDCLGRCNKRST